MCDLWNIGNIVASNVLWNIQSLDVLDVGWKQKGESPPFKCLMNHFGDLMNVPRSTAREKVAWEDLADKGVAGLQKLKYHDRMTLT